MNLLIESSEVKQKYLDMLKKKIPSCLKCLKLFNLGFAKESFDDYLICLENDLICNCENSKIIEQMYTSAGNSYLDVSNYYRKTE